MNQVAVGVADNLHFNMARAANQFFKVDLAVAESLFGLVASDGHHFQEGPFVFNDAHSAPAAAPRRLEHQRIADMGGEGTNLRRVVWQRASGRHHRDPGRLRQSTRGHFIAQGAHDGRRRADED